MSLRVCRQPGCPALVPADAYRGLCDRHRKQHDAERGTTAERGYGPAHTRERARIQTLIDNGNNVRCVTCDAILSGRTWHLGHSDDRRRWIGPQCVTCNLREAGRSAHR